MRELYHKLSGYFEKINSFLGTLSGYVLFLLNCIVFYAVVMRYAFRMPPHWTAETSTFLLLFITFIPAGLVFQKDGHMKVDFVIALMDKKIQRWVNLLSAILCAGYFALLFWQTSRLVIKAFNGEWVSPDIAIPLGYPLLILPIGCALLVISSIFKAINELTSANDMKED